MALVEAFAIMLALVALAVLPCLVVFLVFVDALKRTMHRQRQRIRREIVEAEPEPTAEPAGPPLERIAAEIHRLTRARRTSEAGTPRFIAATRAYDRRLTYACRALEVDEHMSGLTGVDLDLERLRVEGLLLEAGFVLDTDSTRPL